MDDTCLSGFLPRITHTGLLFIAGTIVSLSGCARVPADPNARARGKILDVTIAFRGAVDIARQPRGNYYFVLINRTDNPSDPGPAPVVGPPWGNGFAASQLPDGQGFVGFVSYDRERSAGTYQVFSALVNGQLINPVQNTFTPLGPPDRIQPPGIGGSVLSFQLDISRLPNADKRFLQINIVATDVLPQGAEDTPKRWDALGNGLTGSGTGGGITNFVIMDSQQNQTITNDQQVGGTQEPENDVRDRLNQAVDDASLDIVDWRLQLRDP